jgi:hypothetical protein
MSSDVPESRVAFARWEEFIFSEAGPIVWASDQYERTGVVPYVHERGARVPSLRRLERKWPLFTNGSARSVRELLAEVRHSDDDFRHSGNLGAAGKPLSPTERKALLRFLQLL